MKEHTRSGSRTYSPELDAAVTAASQAAESDSNDQEIGALQFALELALSELAARAGAEVAARAATPGLRVSVDAVRDEMVDGPWTPQEVAIIDALDDVTIQEELDRQTSGNEAAWTALDEFRAAAIRALVEARS